MKTIVITVRGMRSLEDLVVDLQFTPESLEKVGRICGFDGAGHWCHKGFLARSKWIYNDIKRTKVLNTLYLETSPYNTIIIIIILKILHPELSTLYTIHFLPLWGWMLTRSLYPPMIMYNHKRS